MRRAAGRTPGPPVLWYGAWVEKEAFSLEMNQGGHEEGARKGRPYYGTSMLERGRESWTSSRARAKSLWTADAEAAIRLLNKIMPIPFVFRGNASLAEKAPCHRTGGPGARPAARPRFSGSLNNAPSIGRAPLGWNGGCFLIPSLSVRYI